MSFGGKNNNIDLKIYQRKQNKNKKRLTKTILLGLSVLIVYSITVIKMTRHSDVNVVCRQPVCHYAAPLLDGIKTNITSILWLMFSQLYHCTAVLIGSCMSSVRPSVNAVHCGSPLSLQGRCWGLKVVRTLTSSDTFAVRCIVEPQNTPKNEPTTIQQVDAAGGRCKQSCNVPSPQRLP